PPTPLPERPPAIQTLPSLAAQAVPGEGQVSSAPMWPRRALLIDVVAAKALVAGLKNSAVAVSVLVWAPPPAAVWAPQRTTRPSLISVADGMYRNVVMLSAPGGDHDVFVRL